MKKESLRTLGSIKNLMETQNQYKRYMRVQEATRNYQLDRRILCEIAKECGALYKINTIRIILSLISSAPEKADEIVKK